MLQVKCMSCMKPLLFLLLIVCGDAFSASFDCNKATLYTEIEVCADTKLSELDDVLHENYIHMLASNVGAGARNYLRKTQRQWLLNRNSCTSNVCLIKEYKERIDTICDTPVITGIHPMCKKSIDIQ